MKALDGDGDALHYDIIGGSHENYFSIDSTSGTISTTQPLTFDIGASLRLLVHATDDGFPSRSTELAVTFEITPENNNR